MMTSLVGVLNNPTFTKVSQMCLLALDSGCT